MPPGLLMNSSKPSALDVASFRSGDGVPSFSAAWQDQVPPSQQRQQQLREHYLHEDRQDYRQHTEHRQPQQAQQSSWQHAKVPVQPWARPEVSGAVSQPQPWAQPQSSHAWQQRIMLARAAMAAEQGAPNLRAAPAAKTRAQAGGPAAAVARMGSAMGSAAHPVGPRTPPNTWRASSSQVQSHSETLRSHLQWLQTRDPGCVLVVRKINRLGFESASILKQHFSKYGPVDAVLVAHSQVKCPNRQSATRTRPAGLGFVVMMGVADVKAVLQIGDEHRVCDQLINVHSFTSRMLPSQSPWHSSGIGAEDDCEGFQQGDELAGCV